jgi:hypothetical protein
MGQLPVSQGTGPLAEEPAADANTESFFVSFFEPQWGQDAPRQWEDATSRSNSFSHFPQINS